MAIVQSAERAESGSRHRRFDKIFVRILADNLYSNTWLFGIRHTAARIFSHELNGSFDRPKHIARSDAAPLPEIPLDFAEISARPRGDARSHGTPLDFQNS